MTFSFIFSFNSPHVVPHRKRKKGSQYRNEWSEPWLQHQELHALLFTKSVWVPLLPATGLCEQWRVVRWSLQFKVLIPEDLKVLTSCGCNYKGSTFSSLILRPWLLVRPKSGARPPAWRPDAQPTEAQVSWALNFTITVGDIMMPAKNQHTSMNEVQLHQESGPYKYPETQDFLFLQGTEKWLVHFVHQKLILEL